MAKQNILLENTQTVSLQTYAEGETYWKNTTVLVLTKNK